MLSGDVAALRPASANAGCYALLLTPKGRIAADLHVLCVEEAIWLEVDLDALGDVVERLDRFLIADDVELTDISASRSSFALEGPSAPEILSRAAGRHIEIEADSFEEVKLDGVSALAGAWGWSGEPAYQILVPPDTAQAVTDALFEAAGEERLVHGDFQTLEVLRIESGTPRLGAELGLDVLPAEVGLVGRAVDLDKGCYTGQEIVARIHTYGHVNRRLLPLKIATAEPIDPQTPLVDEDGDQVGRAMSSAAVPGTDWSVAIGILPNAFLETGGELYLDAADGPAAELIKLRED